MSTPTQALPTQRFVRLRHADPDGNEVTTTFLGAEPGAELGSVENGGEENGVIADIAQVDPARATLIQERMQQLIAHNDAVMAWLEADPQHAAFFAQDPIAAIRQAIPGLPADFFKGWGKA